MTDESTLGPVARRLAATERVMCIEDEADIAAFLRAYFRAAGYDLVHVDPASADEAVAEVERLRPDLILLDLRLRTFSGMDIYRALRADDRYAFTPIVVVSAQADTTAPRPTGLDDIVAKPFNTNTLADLVRARIDAAKALEDGARPGPTALVSADDVAARLGGEIAGGGPVSFALVELTTTDTIVAEVGDEGCRFVVATLLKYARRSLPEGVVLGATSPRELAVIFPSMAADESAALLTSALAGVDATFGFAGGAVVPVGLAAGLASFPAHGTDADSVYMAADLALGAAVGAGERLHVAI